MRMIGGNQFPTLIEAKILIEQWWREYNKIRPHSAVHYCPPAPEAIQPIMISLTLGAGQLDIVKDYTILGGINMNIYVGNLAPEVTEEELKQEFTAFGKVASISIIKDKYSGQSRGFGFVEMPSMTEGQAAISGLKGKVLKDRTLEVSEARPRSERGSYRDQRSGSYHGRSSSFGSGGKQ
jgi:hypothetical protein